MVRMVANCFICFYTKLGVIFVVAMYKHTYILYIPTVHDLRTSQSLNVKGFFKSNDSKLSVLVSQILKLVG